MVSVCYYIQYKPGFYLLRGALVEVWLVALLIRSNVGWLLSATVSGTCADFVSMTHLIGLPTSVMRSGQVSVCRAN